MSNNNNNSNPPNLRLSDTNKQQQANKPLAKAPQHPRSTTAPPLASPAKLPAAMTQFANNKNQQPQTTVLSVPAATIVSEPSDTESSRKRLASTLEADEDVVFVEKPAKKPKTEAYKYDFLFDQVAVNQKNKEEYEKCKEEFEKVQQVRNEKLRALEQAQKELDDAEAERQNMTKQRDVNYDTLMTEAVTKLNESKTAK